MRGALELVGFVGVAVAAHLVAWPQGSEDGAEAAGAGGQAALTVAAARPSMEQMVARWEKPVEVALNAPKMQRVEGETAPQVARPSEMQMRQVALPALSAAPGASALPVVQPPPEPWRPQEVPPETSRRPAARPADLAPVPEAKPSVTSSPKPRPKAAAKPAKPKDKAPSRASQGATAKVAEGQGGGTVKGAQETTGTKALSKAQRNSLIAGWGGQIRERIARRAPRGAGRGTAHVRITVAGNGGLLGVSLAKSSGNARIDQLALAAVRGAGRFPAAPKALGIGSHTFQLPIKSR